MRRLDVDVVVPTRGHPSLVALLDSLGTADAVPARVLLVDARPQAGTPLLPVPPPPALDVEILAVPGAGRAGARNVGWRAASAPWVAFLDDDVVPGPDWAVRLAADLAAAGPAAGSAGPFAVTPHVGAGRAPTPALADLACRRGVLTAVGGLDERLVGDDHVAVDLALRLRARGQHLAPGTRTAVRPRPARRHRPAGAGWRRPADEPLLRAVHGPAWPARAALPPPPTARDLVATTALLAAAATMAAPHRRRLALPGAAAAAAIAAAAATGRARPSRSLLAPVVATVQRTAALLRRPHLLADRSRAPRPLPRPAAVLFDRDGTLVVDVPYNGDPARVEPVPGARVALERLRAAGIPTAVITNQSGVARGLLDHHRVDAVNRRVDDLLGPLGPWLVCPHGPDDGCACRKPAPGLVEQAAAALGVPPAACAVVGDIGADVVAAAAAGARGVLVPTPVTRSEEVTAAAETAPDLPSAVELLLGSPA